MQEYFLHFLWKYGLFNTQQLQTTDGLPLVLENRGSANTNSGPDFSEARIRIGEMAWSGHVEIHVFASDWQKHNHQVDKAYDTVILHVVYRNDANIARTDGTVIPCLELYDKIPAGYLNAWQTLSKNLSKVPCAAHNPVSFEREMLQMKHRVLTERMIQKAEKAASMAEKTMNHWEEVMYKMMGRYLGRKVNDDAMEMLTDACPFALVKKYRHNPPALEALLFGQSGMLSPDFTEAYPKALWKEYQFLQAKHQIKPMNPAAWKFGRLRPPNFPSLRIAQFLAILCNWDSLFVRLMEARSLSELQGLLSYPAHPYWQTHFRFGAVCAERNAAPGPDTINGIIVNAILPMMFTYGKHLGAEELQERSIDLLTAIPPENNSITRYWQSMGFINSSAYDSQACMGLQALYCSRQRCLECSVGQKIIRNEEKITTT